MEKKQKVVYPECIDQLVGSLGKTPCIYVLEVEPDYYKYGKSRDIRERLRTHFRTLKFTKIINVYTCNQSTTMDKVETGIGSMCDHRRERVKKYEQVEIINTTNINLYLEFIQNEIARIDTARDLPEPIPVNPEKAAEIRIATLEATVRKQAREIKTLQDNMARLENDLADKVIQKIAARMAGK